ncbi:hypothetical protein [Puia sp.]|uniref:hypothetical protein n=1 Tax=Puia sp. TaxID=2045100 RepID=UPI002F40D892
MLSKEETAFIDYWEKNRLRRKKTVRQFLLGVPLGLLFAVPILLSLTSGWYKRANMEANSPDFNPRVLFVALLLIVGFTSIFWQRHKWDQYEQRYQELLARRSRDQQPQTPPASVAQSQTPPSTQSPSASAAQPETPPAGKSEPLSAAQPENPPAGQSEPMSAAQPQTPPPAADQK